MNRQVIALALIMLALAAFFISFIMWINKYMPEVGEAPGLQERPTTQNSSIAIEEESK